MKVSFLSYLPILKSKICPALVLYLSFLAKHLPEFASISSCYHISCCSRAGSPQGPHLVSAALPSPCKYTPHPDASVVLSPSLLDPQTTLTFVCLPLPLERASPYWLHQAISWGALILSHVQGPPPVILINMPWGPRPWWVLGAVPERCSHH